VHVNDFDDIEALDKLANSVTGVSKIERRLLNSPFELGGILFYPLTVAKSLWFTEKVKEWDIDDSLTDALMFWVLTVPIKTDALDQYETYKSVDRAMRKMAKKMHFTHAEINEVCSRCIGDVSGDTETESSSDSANFGGMVACLIREFGQSPDYWLYETPIEKIHVLYAQIIARVSQEENASKVKSVKGGKAKAQNVTHKVRSLGDFQAMARKIEEKWSLEDDQ